METSRITNIYSTVGKDIYLHILSFLGIDRGFLQMLWPDTYNGWNLLTECIDIDNPCSKCSTCSTCGKKTANTNTHEIACSYLTLHPWYDTAKLYSTVYIMPLNGTQYENNYFLRFCTTNCLTYFTSNIVMEFYFNDREYSNGYITDTNDDDYSDFDDWF